MKMCSSTDIFAVNDCKILSLCELGIAVFTKSKDMFTPIVSVSADALGGMYCFQMLCSDRVTLADTRKWSPDLFQASSLASTLPLSLDVNGP